MQLFEEKIERVVLGTVIQQPWSLTEIEPMLKPEYFFVPFHKDVVNAIHRLLKERTQVDVLTIIEVIENKTPGTAIRVTDLTNEIYNGVIQQKILFLAETYFKRQLVDLAFVAFSELNAGKDFYEMKDFVSKGLLDLQQDIEGTKGDKSFSKSVERVESHIESAMENPEHISGITTGNSLLDSITGGWQNTDLIIIAARPGMGKTARALGFLKSAVESGKQAMFMSLEMSADQLITRLISEGTGLDLMDINRGRLSKYSHDAIKRIAAHLKTLPIVVNDNGRTTIYDIATKCRILKSQNKLDILIVDYLQIVKGSKSDKLSRNDLIGMFTSEFKNIAKECKIPVIVLCQLNRSGEGAGDKRPELQQLRESGSIEQDADFVGFIYRPSYYTKNDQAKETDPFFSEMDEQEYLKYSEFIIAKHRNGKLATVKEYFSGSTQRFTDTMPVTENFVANFFDSPEPVNNAPF